MYFWRSARPLNARLSTPPEKVKNGAFVITHPKRLAITSGTNSVSIRSGSVFPALVFAALRERARRLVRVENF